VLVARAGKGIDSVATFVLLGSHCFSLLPLLSFRCFDACLSTLAIFVSSRSVFVFLSLGFEELSGGDAFALQRAPGTRNGHFNGLGTAINGGISLPLWMSLVKLVHLWRLLNELGTADKMDALTVLMSVVGGWIKSS